MKFCMFLICFLFLFTISVAGQSVSEFIDFSNRGILIPNECNSEVICEVIDFCGVASSVEGSLIEEPSVDRVTKELCSFSDCDYRYFRYSECEEVVDDNVSFSPVISDFFLKSVPRSLVIDVFKQENEIEEQVASVKLEGRELNVLFGPEGGECYNSVKDEGEEGIDCGGNCSECRKEYNEKLIVFLLWGIFMALLFYFVFRRF